MRIFYSFYLFISSLCVLFCFAMDPRSLLLLHMNDIIVSLGVDPNQVAYSNCMNNNNNNRSYNQGYLTPSSDGTKQGGCYRHNSLNTRR